MAPRSLRVGLLAKLVVLAAATTAAAEEPPFAVRSLRVPGRPVEAFAASFGLAVPRLVVLSVEGSPPEERRWVSVFPPVPRSGERPGDPWRLEVPPEVVAVDVGDAGGEPGLEVALVTAEALLVHHPSAEVRALPLGRTLPLPPRSRQLSRLALLRDWSADGAPAALLPALSGLLLVPLDGAPPRALGTPVLTDFETIDERRPVYEGYTAARLVWPGLALADDNGDGRADLFAANRFQLQVFRTGQRGLSPIPTRTARMPAFSPEEERRHTSNTLRAFPRDLDGDGDADLVVHRTEGSLLRSHATTTVHPNTGSGASPDEAASASLSARGGFGSVELEDLDGDGRVEVVQTVVPFGVLQLVRVLVRRRVEASLRVHRFAGDGLDRLERSWQTELGYPLDFDAGRIVGLLPDVRGDWNGDGLRDLIHGDGANAVRIRLGERGEGGPGFGGAGVRQELPAADRAVIADLDGDGLDDLVVYDPLESSGRVHLAVNRGTLPGSPPRIRSAD